MKKEFNNAIHFAVFEVRRPGSVIDHLSIEIGHFSASPAAAFLLRFFHLLLFEEITLLVFEFLMAFVLKENLAGFPSPRCIPQTIKVIHLLFSWFVAAFPMFYPRFPA